MSVRLRPIGDDEFARWLPEVRDGYVRDMVVNGGVSEERARAKAFKDVEQLFPDEKPSADQVVLVIEADGSTVGDLWLAEREVNLERSLWIYGVRVDEEYRGRGYGKAAMLHAEAEARRRGLDHVAFMVFGGNEVARSLYRSLGYVETAVFMSKQV